MERIEFRAMGSHMLAVLEVDATHAGALQQAPGWFETWEQSLSRFRPDSELSRLNRCSGQWVAVSEPLWQVLQAGMAAAQASDGLVIPTALNALEAIGYDRSFESIRSDYVKLDFARNARIDWSDIDMNPVTHTVRLPAGVRLDLGGVAKGWAADEAARRLAAYGPALVDAGGDIAVHGLRSGDEPFAIGVGSPWQPDQHIEMIRLREGGVATSGRDFRRWAFNGTQQHHIIDPRTSRPAETDVLSATVIAPRAEEAEVAAKVALILGGTAGLEWIEQRPSLAVELAMESGEVLQSSRFPAYVWREPMGVNES